MDKSIKQLVKENEELKSRLTETKETLDAIRNGDMDAIVVSGRKGVQVYSISYAETPYRTFIEEMSEGAITISKEGIILYCNKKFSEFVHEPIESILGSHLKRFIAAKDKIKLNNLLFKQPDVLNKTIIISLFHPLTLKLSLHRLPSYLEGDNFIIIATDITELKKKEKELLELHRLLEKRLGIIERLRMQLIDRTINDEVEKNNLKHANDELVKEISRYKLVKSEQKQKQSF